MLERFYVVRVDDQPHTLALIRITGGAMLFYTHLVWSIGLVDFLGPHGWLRASVLSTDASAGTCGAATPAASSLLA